MNCLAPRQDADGLSLIIASSCADGGGTVVLANFLANEEPSILGVVGDSEQEPAHVGVGRPRPAVVKEDGRLSLAKRLAYLLQAPTETLASPLGPLEWHGTLFPYQMDGVRTLLSRDELLLADDMGLGKTIQAIAALRILAIQRRVESALVVVPASLVAQWRGEIRAWAPELRVSTVHGLAEERAYQWSAPAHVFLTTYETLRSDFTSNPASPPRRRT